MADDLTTDDLANWLRAFADSVNAHAEELTRLDAAIGDADHGTNMQRGMTAARQVLDAAATPAELFKSVGMTLVSKVGGASGPLYGTFFLRMAADVGDADQLSPTGFASAVRAGVQGVSARGKASPGEKTMLDALVPASEVLSQAVADGESLSLALDAATQAAEQGRDATRDLIARKGRASYLGERSIDHLDPGATSAALLIRATGALRAPQGD